MNKAIRKIVALALVLLMVLSNVSFLNTDALSIEEETTSKVKEPMVEEPEVQERETETPKETVSKKIVAKEETAKAIVTSKEEVAEKDVSEEVATPKEDSEVLEKEEKNSADYEEPKAEEPKVEEPKAEEPKIEKPIKEVFTPKTLEMREKLAIIEIEKIKKEETSTEPEVEQPMEELQEPEIETKGLSTLFLKQKIFEFANVGGNTTVPQENAKPDEWTIMTSDKTNSEITIKYQGSPNYVSFVKFRSNTQMSEGFDGMEEKIVARRGESEITMEAPTAKEGYRFKEWSKVEKELIPGTENTYYDVYEATYEQEPNNQVPTVLLQKQVLKVADIKSIKKDHECYKADDDNWTQITDKKDASITVKYGGCYCHVSVARFQCDLTMCEGFDGSKQQEVARRGGSEITMEAPTAKDGYRFKEWKKVGKELVPGTENTYYDIYEAIYEQEPNKQVPSVLLQKQDLKVADINSIKKDHTCYKADDDNWTQISDEKSATITIKYGGCYCHVTVARFQCDLSMCEGFDGSKQQEVARRGGSEITMTAPTAKKGFKFDRWEKEIIGTVDVYTAVYIPE